MADYAPRLLPGMDCKSYPLEPRLIKEYEIFSGGVGNIAFDYDYSAPVDSCGSDPEAAPLPLGFLDLPQCKRVVTLIRKQIKKSCTSPTTCRPHRCPKHMCPKDYGKIALNNIKAWYSV